MPLCLTRIALSLSLVLPTASLVACSSDGGDGGDDDLDAPNDPDAAEVVEVDRFSAAAGTLMVRAGDELPGPGEPIDFDQGPFITRGLGPDGAPVRYYNFDVQPTAPAPIYALFRADGDPVAGQLNIVDVVPGDAGYNDFWQVVRVTVPDDYEANRATSVDDLEAAGFAMETTETLVNCPIVPPGSTARLRHDGGDAGLTRGWYQGRVVSYFSFLEAPLTTSAGAVPVSPIYVAFNVDPGEEGGGPPSGFVTEEDGSQTHNVVATLPGDAGYSPLWSVQIYDNDDFAAVSDLASVEAAELLAADAALVNCPVVEEG